METASEGDGSRGVMMWSSPRKIGEPAPGEIHFFRASLDQPPSRLADLTGTLSADEKERARNFRRDGDRRRFIAGRGQLREILGTLLRIEPESLAFEYGPAGKPRVGKPRDCGSLHFSLAHSEALVVYAVAGEEIGVDVECLHPVPEAQSIAERFFSTEKAARLRLLPFDAEMWAFFECWTRREASAKAAGLGFSVPQEKRLHSFAFSEWKVQTFEPAAGYVGAFATLCAEPRLHWWNWP